MGIWKSTFDAYQGDGLNQNTGRKGYKKFGRAIGIPANTNIDVWNGPVAEYTFTAGVIGTAGVPYYISSSDEGDTQDVYIQGIDENGFEQEFVVTLNGQNKVRIGNSLLWFRFWRAKNVGTSDFLGSIYIYEDVAITAGVPDDLTYVRGFVTNGDNQSQMAILSSPINEIAVVDFIVVGLSNKVQASVVFELYNRLPGEVFALDGTYAVNSVGTGIFNRSLPIGFNIAPGTDIVMKANSGTVGVSVSAEFGIRRRVIF